MDPKWQNKTRSPFRQLRSFAKQNINVKAISPPKLLIKDRKDTDQQEASLPG